MTSSEIKSPRNLLVQCSCVTLLFFNVLSAQNPALVLDKPHVSSQGVTFVPMPGTTVMFATWETRVADYEEFVKESNYAWSYKPHFNQTGDHPAVGVNLQDAIAYCNWLTTKERKAERIDSNQSYRLPSNEEWDAAINLTKARKTDAGIDDKVQDERVFPWGLDWPPPKRFANFAAQEIPGYEDGFDYTAPVGQFPPSGEGLFDLSGNVWEWVWDRKLQALPVGGLRGGSWAYFRSECLTSAYRYEVPAELRAPTIGFRCVFEDRRRTAVILADQKIKRETEAKQKQVSMAQTDIDPKEVAAMREKLKDGGTATVSTDVSKLAPAVTGQPFKNSLGMDFVPMSGKEWLAGKFEVRAQDYEAFLRATDGDWVKKPAFLNSGVQPAVGVSWKNAMAFCEWLTEEDRKLKIIPPTASYRLPTDQEWSAMADQPEETGATAAERHLGNKLHFPWGNDLWPPVANSVNIESDKVVPTYRDAFSYTGPVGSFEPNSKGIHDLGGNAAEWCADEWATGDNQRVIRGGSWLFSEKESLLSSFRGHLGIEGARNDLGFRCVLQF
jgi:formylglycine-generating enzyme required for sulfatase activity